MQATVESEQPIYQSEAIDEDATSHKFSDKSDNSNNDSKRSRPATIVTKESIVPKPMKGGADTNVDKSPGLNDVNSPSKDAIQQHDVSPVPKTLQGNKDQGVM